MTRARRLSGQVLLVSLLALLLATPASGQLQDIAFSWECPAEAKVVPPAGAPGRWSCTATMQYKSAGTGFTDPMQPAIVGIEFPEHPDWMVPVAAPPVISTLGPFPQGEVLEIPVEITVGVTRDAPAFETSNLWVRPYVIQHPRSEGELSKITVRSQVNLSVTPGYMSSFNVRVDEKAQEARPPDPLRYTIEIDNFSNGATRFDFSLVVNETGGFVPLAPDSLVVAGAQPGVGLGGGNASAETNETEATAQNSATTPFEVQTPLGNGYANDRRVIQLRVDSSFGPDPTVEGISSIVTVVAQAKGLYVPGPAAPVTALALVGVALVLARRGRP